MPDDIHNAAEACLRCADVVDKLHLAAALQQLAASRGMRCGSARTTGGIAEPGRPALPQLVLPAQLAQRRITTPQGQAALIHAVAHIEFNAINLACDAVYRFRDLPERFYVDWAGVAAEEARHFAMLQGRLGELGYSYGDFPAHDGLWELARRTAGDVLLRMALVPRVMEARGLDVTPGMIARFRGIGDVATAEILAVILREEVGHVEAGSRWFRYLCAQRGLDPETTYFELLAEHLPGGVRCPLHKPARRQAGFSETELSRLEALCTRPLRPVALDPGTPTQGVDAGIG